MEDFNKQQHQEAIVFQQMTRPKQPGVQLKLRKDLIVQPQEEKNQHTPDSVPVEPEQQTTQLNQPSNLLEENDELIKGELGTKVHEQAEPGLVQLAPKDSHYGTFDDKQYKFDNQGKEQRVAFELEFTPNDKADATKVGLTQSAKVVQEGKNTPLDPNTASKTTPKGYAIDRIPTAPNPLYATNEKSASDPEKLESYTTNNFSGQHAEKEGSSWTKKAILKD